MLTAVNACDVTLESQVGNNAVFDHPSPLPEYVATDSPVYLVELNNELMPGMALLSFPYRNPYIPQSCHHATVLRSRISLHVHHADHYF